MAWVRVEPVCFIGDREDCATTPEMTEKRVRRIALNFPRVNSLLISTHDAAYLVAELDRARSALRQTDGS